MAERRPYWLWGAAALLALFVVGALISPILAPGPDGSGDGTPTLAAPPNAISISIVSSNTKQTWLHQAVDAFNAASQSEAKLQLDGKPIFVVILQEEIDGKKVDYRSGTMVSDTVSRKIEPTVLSPGEESWILKFEKEWQAAQGTDPVKSGDIPVLVRTPLVVAMWESRAKALGCWPTPGPDCTWTTLRSLATSPNGWGAYGNPQWRKFKFGYGYFGESNSGTLGVISMCMTALGRTEGLTIGDVEPTNACGTFVNDVEKAKVHSGKSDLWLLEKMVTGGPEYLDAVITYESNVIATNRSSADSMREPLVATYPQDGTIVVGHPFAILDGTPWVSADQARAALVFRDFLLSRSQQEAVLSLGLRPADTSVTLGSPIEPAYGANPQARLVALQVPATLVIDRIGEVWHQVKKHAVIAIVFDKSGSMSGGKITAAVKGAQEFVNRMDGQDWLLWLPFDDGIYPGASGLKSEVGERLVQQIASTSADGGTSLYDAILYAYDELQEMRQTSGDTVRYGIVVLSDGQDTSSTRTLTILEAALQPSEKDPTGIQIHTIAIGDDADEQVLKKIAAAAHGRYWKTENETQIVAVYRDIAAHY